jgi:transcriptional regulator GlxA family with amidase domain
VNISILLYGGVTTLDVVGPYEVLSRIPAAHIDLVAAEAGPIRTDTGFLDLTATANFSDVPSADILIVPGGGRGSRNAAHNPSVIAWVRQISEGARYTASVCTGAFILAAAGLLRGKRATTHWSDRDELRAYDVEVVERRVVESGRIVTAAGVSAGIDMALALVDRVAGRDVAEAIQLVLEYDPEPPFSSGSPRRARPEVVALAQEMMRTSRLTEEGRSSIRALGSD